MEHVGVGMLGLGTVGTEVARRLIDEFEMIGERAGAIPVLRAVAVRDAEKHRDVDLKNVRLTTDVDSVIGDPTVSIVVEVIGGDGATAALIERALRAGQSVVTANKAVIATDGPRLAQLAASHHAVLRFEAAVGAGIPVVALLRDSLRGDRITAIDAVINGTTNAVLTRMRTEGLSLPAALADAQRRGLAEADPSFDIDAWDATHKLVILAWLAFGARVDPVDVDRQGIAGVEQVDVEVLASAGHTVRLLAHAETTARGAIHLRVRPAAVGPGHLLHDVDDVDNAVIISSDLAGTLLVRGSGAGGPSTASAVVNDIIGAVVERGTPGITLPDANLHPALDREEAEIAAYVRVRLGTAEDACALVVSTLEDRGIPIDEVIDLPGAAVAVLTGAAPIAVHERALETLDTLAAVENIACVLDRVSVPA